MREIDIEIKRVLSMIDDYNTVDINTRLSSVLVKLHSSKDIIEEIERYRERLAQQKRENVEKGF